MVPEFVIDAHGAKIIAQLAQTLGESGNEVAVLLAGKPVAGGPVHLDRILVPRQYAHQSEYGCGLLIEGGCLNRFGPLMRAESRRIYGILHSHPTEAYHSPTDAEGVLMQFHGAFSIVIPDFGRRTNVLDGSAAYKFDYSSGWKPVPSRELIAIAGSKSAELIYDE